MTKRHDKGPDNKYHIGNKTYDLLIGSRAQVWHETAYMTTGGLKKHDLIMKNGRILSKKKSHLAKTQKHLKGFLQPKGSGVFGVKKTKKSSKKSKRSSKKRSHRRK